MTVITESFWSFAWQLVTYAGGAAAIAYAVFKFLGEKWLDQHFQKRLEEFRHEKTVEIERLRIEVQSLLSGKLKLQERDFDILPNAWKHLNEAYRELQRSTAVFRQMPDLNKFDDQTLEEFLKAEGFSRSIVEDIKSAKDKTHKFDQYRTRKWLDQSQNALAALKEYVDENSVLMDSELKLKFEEVAQKMWSTLVTKRFGHEVDDWQRQSKAYEELEKVIDPLVKEIQLLINQRLRAHSGS